MSNMGDSFDMGREKPSHSAWNEVWRLQRQRLCFVIELSGSPSSTLTEHVVRGMIDAAQPKIKARQLMGAFRPINPRHLSLTEVSHVVTELGLEPTVDANSPVFRVSVAIEPLDTLRGAELVEALLAGTRLRPRLTGMIGVIKSVDLELDER